MDIREFPWFIPTTLLLCAAVTLAQEEPGNQRSAHVAVVPPHTRVDRQVIENQTQLFEEVLRSGALDEAENLAKRRVETAIAFAGPRSVEVAEALTDLGAVQLRKEYYDAARQNFESAIDLLIDAENRLHARLIRPLEGLGSTYLDSGRPALAEVTYVRAVHITHVNEGPHNAAQIGLLESLAEARLQLGDTEAAKDVQDTIRALLERHSDDNKMAIVAPLMRHADWLHRAGFIAEERETYRDIIRIIRSEKDKNDLSLVAPLMKLGTTYLYMDSTGSQPLSGTANPTGEVYFKRAIRIVESNPDASWEILADAKIAFGDFYTLRGDFYRARSNYEEAWQLLSRDTSRHIRRDELLGQPFPLTTVSVRPYYGGEEAPFEAADDDDLLQGKVTATYAIDDHGRVNSLVVAEIEPPEFVAMGQHVERELRQQVFRPRVDESGPLSTSARSFTHWFKYTPAELDASRARARAGDD